MDRIKKFLSLFLCVVLFTVSLSDVAIAAPSTTKKIRFYFRNFSTEEQKEILKENIHFQNVTTGETIYLTDENIQVNEQGQYAGCFLYEFVDIGINDIVQMINKQSMVISEYSHVNSANIYYPIVGYHLSVDGVIVDSIYSYASGITLPYNGTEPMFQKAGYYLKGWYSSEEDNATRLADAEYGEVQYLARDLTLYAKWNEHIHSWSSQWSSDEDAHFHECNGKGTCDIVNNEDKRGYEEHNFYGNEDIEKEPTCTETGIMRIYCTQSGCNAYKEEEIEKLEHIDGYEWLKDESGHWNACFRDNCNAKLNFAGHDFGEWVTITEPTYEEIGLKTRMCTTCGYVENEDIPVLVQGHVHSFTGVEEVINKPTCTEKGTLRTYCIENDCLEYVDSDIDELNHQWIEKWEYDKTHHFEKCERCTERNKEEVHDFGEWRIVKEATFNENGSRTRKCHTCGCEETQIIPPGNHSHVHNYTGEEEIIKEPTCIEKGILRTHCFENECTAYKDTDIDKLGHQWIEEWEHDETHHFEECERCTAHNKEELHNFGEWTVVREAVKGVDGIEKCTCETCGYEKTREIEYKENTTEDETTDDEESTTKIEITTEEETTESGTTIDKETTESETTVNIETTESETTVDEETTINNETTINDETTVEEETTINEETTIEEATTEEKLPPNDDEDDGDDGDADDDDKNKDEEPPLKTGDFTPINMYATLAMISGMSYVLIMFSDSVFAMSEEQKKDIVYRLIRWAKKKSRFKKIIALMMITVVLAYYHAIGKKVNRKQVLAAVRAD